MSARQSPNRSAERMLDILDCFLYKERMALMEVAVRAGLPASTTSRLLQTLEERDFLVRDEETKFFSLGGKVGELAQVYNGGRFDLLRCAAVKPMGDLARTYNETVRLFVRDGGYKLCIEAIQSTRELSHIVTIGERHELIYGAAGKVLMAYMPPAQRAALLAGRTVDEQLEKVLADGYALSVGEREVGLAGLAAPIFAAPGRLVAAVSLSGLSIRLLDGQISEKIQDTISCGHRISEALRGATVDEKEFRAV